MAKILRKDEPKHKKVITITQKTEPPQRFKKMPKCMIPNKYKKVTYDRNIQFNN